MQSLPKKPKNELHACGLLCQKQVQRAAYHRRGLNAELSKPKKKTKTKFL